jgi:hypothetical protein
MSVKKKLKDIAAGFEGSNAIVNLSKPDAEALLSVAGEKKEFEGASKTLSGNPAGCTGKELCKLVALLPGD